jgi:hypothetical protein
MVRPNVSQSTEKVAASVECAPATTRLTSSSVRIVCILCSSLYNECLLIDLGLAYSISAAEAEIPDQKPIIYRPIPAAVYPDDVPKEKK